MEKKEGSKTKIWIYAVVLFTSAFIVLLLTAYSQIRLNKNLNNYRDRISNTENEKNRFQLNFTSAQETNNKLKEEIQKLTDEKEALTKEVEDGKAEKAREEEKNKKVIENYARLAESQVLFLDEKYIDAASLLTKNIDQTLLDDKSKEVYQALLKQATAKAGDISYKEGYDCYKKKDYANAVLKLSQALDIAPSDESADSWMYYLALSENKSENESKAVELMEKLMAGYPDSTYFKKAKSFYDSHMK